MRLLLGTHALLWWLFDDSSLSKTAYEAIETGDNEVWVSAISIYEILIKRGRPGMPVTDPHQLDHVMSGQLFRRLPVTFGHGHYAATLPGPLRDPFDRILIAQATIEDLVLISKDEVFSSYPIRLLWKAKGQK